MRRKPEVLECFKKLKAIAESHTNSAVPKLHVHGFHGSITADTEHPLRLKVILSDNGVEYLSGAFEHFPANHSIQHQSTVKYSLQHNGVAERMNPTLLDSVCSMIHHKSLPKKSAQKLPPLPCMCATCQVSLPTTQCHSVPFLACKSPKYQSYACVWGSILICYYQGARQKAWCLV